MLVSPLGSVGAHWWLLKCWQATGISFIENVARTVSDYELIWVTILIMGLLGLAFDLFMRLMIAKLIPWRGKDNTLLYLLQSIISLRWCSFLRQSLGQSAR